MIGDLMLIFENNKNETTDARMHLHDHQKLIVPFFKSVKTRFIDSNGDESEMDLVQLIIKISNKCLDICSVNGISGLIDELHANIIVGIAAKLSYFMPRIRNKESISFNEVINHLFTDFDQFKRETQRQLVCNYHASHQLKVFIYQILQTPNNSYFDSTENTINVHVIFVPKAMLPTNENLENKEDEEKEEQIDKISNIHLTNLCVPNHMRSKQICEFMLKNLQTRYAHLDVMPYKDEHNLVKYESLSYKEWNYKKKKWNKVRPNDKMNSKNINGIPFASILLMSEDESIETPYHVLIGHIHRYALMSLRQHDNVYYYKQQDKDATWLRGTVSQIHPDKGSHNRTVQIQCTDPKSKLFSKKNAEDLDDYIFDIFTHGKESFTQIIPSKLLKWLPAKYLVPNPGKEKIENWQQPNFCFVASFLMDVQSTIPLYDGKIVNDQENEKSGFQGALKTFSGCTPYPFAPSIIGMKLEIGKKKVALKQFMKQHFDKIGNNVYGNNVDKVYSWSRWYEPNSKGADLHSFLAKDLQRIQVIESENNKFKMFFITAQHIEAMKKLEKSLNYDILRYCRDSTMEKECFILTVFDRAYDRYSDILNDRFGVVYSEDLNEMCPLKEVYTKCGYLRKQIKKEKKQKKKEVVPPHKNANQRQTWSKQNSRNKLKQAKKELEKDWDLAMEKIVEWAKKNRYSIPTDADRWRSTIEKGEIRRNIGPLFDNDDLDKLSALAADINVRELFTDDEDEEKVVQSPPKKKQRSKQKNKNKNKKKMNNGNSDSAYQQPEMPPHAGLPPHAYRNQQQNNGNYHNGDDEQSVKSVKSMQSSKSTLSIKNMANVDFQTDSVMLKSIIPKIVNHASNQSDHISLKSQKEICENLTRGTLFGVNRKNVNNKEELIQLFKNVIDLVSTYTQIKKGYFVFAKNWEELRQHNTQIHGDTLLFYVQFASRTYNLEFQGVMASQTEFVVYMPIKKPSSKETKCKKYVFANSYDRRQMDEMEQMKGNIEFMHGVYDDNLPLELLDVYDENHPLNKNQIAQDLIKGNDQIFDRLKNVDVDVYQRNKRFGADNHSVHSSVSQHNGHRNVQQNVYNNDSNKQLPNGANEGHSVNGDCKHQNDNDNGDVVFENETQDWITSHTTYRNQTNEYLQQTEREVMKLRNMVKLLKKDKKALIKENEALKNKNATMSMENSVLTDQNAKMREKLNLYQNPNHQNQNNGY